MLNRNGGKPKITSKDIVSKDLQIIGINEHLLKEIRYKTVGKKDPSTS